MEGVKGASREVSQRWLPIASNDIPCRRYTSILTVSRLCRRYESMVSRLITNRNDDRVILDSAEVGTKGAKMDKRGSIIPLLTDPGRQAETAALIIIRTQATLQDSSSTSLHRCDLNTWLHRIFRIYSTIGHHDG